MITLPTTPRNRAVFQISKMAPATSWSGQDWRKLPVPEILQRTITGSGLDGDTPTNRITGTVRQGGYGVDYITRGCLPDEDQAAFSVDIGTINGVTVTPEDLKGHWIRIDALTDPNFPQSSDTTLPSSGYQLVFVGFVYSVRTTMNPTTRSGSANGRATYYCMGVLSRCKDWPLNTHAVIRSGSPVKVYGHPGYNYPISGWFRSSFGNKSTDTDTTPWDAGDTTGGFLAHSIPIQAASAAAWTDVEAIKHALSAGRREGEPVFTVDFSNAPGLFDGKFAWPVNIGDTTMDLLRRICNRQRGRGCVYADWESDDTPTGDINLFLRARPSFSGTVEYYTKLLPMSLTLTAVNTIQGQTVSAASSVDLVGDHRFYGNLQYEDRSSAVFDYIELIGERIQVVGNLHLFDNGPLVKGWNSTDMTRAAPRGRWDALKGTPASRA